MKISNFCHSIAHIEHRRAGAQEMAIKPPYQTAGESHSDDHRAIHEQKKQTHARGEKESAFR